MLSQPIKDLRKARILVTNDDGIHAPGLRALEQVARTLSDDVWVCAPEVEQSAASHSLTIHRPLRVRHISEQRYAVDGSPTDCVLLAVEQILAERKPDLVLSGINRGGNTGEDVTYSGTVAAAMEATLLGRRGIALSQEFEDDHPVKWATAEHYAPDIIRRLVSVPWDTDTLMNVNFPDMIVGSVKGIKAVRQGRRKLGYRLEERLDPRGRPYVWIGSSRQNPFFEGENDIVMVKEGYITVTPLFVDLTHDETLDRIARVLL
jgi:5'-nucleotidase